jgi:hypothetical protein
LLISVEPSGTPARMLPAVVVGVDVGVDEAARLLAPEPHMPDIPDVSRRPEEVDIPELCIIPDVVDMPEVADSPADMPGETAELPADAPVAGIEAPGAIPPPS